MSIPNLTGRVDPIVESTIRDLYQRLNEQANSTAGAFSKLPKPLTIGDVIAAISAGKSTSLNVTGLTGLLSQPQNAKVTNNTSAPKPGNPQAQNGTLFTINNQLFYYQNGQAIAVESVAVVLIDTHANRLANYPASNYVTGTLFYETDRQILYVDVSSTWTYATGVMEAIIASRPTDLSTPDSGFLFLATDWGITYRWTGAAWNYFSGTYVATFASRPTSLGAGDVGFLFYASNWEVTWRWSGTAWIYYAGVYSAPTASRPATLGINDTNFLFIDTTLKLLEQWNGSAWITIGATNTNLVLAYTIQTGAYTIQATDFQVVSANSGAATFTLPDATTVPGQVFAIVNASSSTGLLSITPPSQTIGGLVNQFLMPGSSLIIASDGTTNWNVLGAAILGAWQSFIPSSITNLSSITTDCAYTIQENGKTIVFRISITGRVVTSATNVTFTVPWTAKSNNQSWFGVEVLITASSITSFGMTISGNTMSTQFLVTSASNVIEFSITGVCEAA